MPKPSTDGPLNFRQPGKQQEESLSVLQDVYLMKHIFLVKKRGQQVTDERLLV